MSRLLIFLSCSCRIHSASSAHVSGLPLKAKEANSHLGQRSLYTTCTLKIPQSLTRRPQSLQTQTQPHTRNQTPNLNTNTNISNRKTPNPNNIHPPDLTLPQSLLAPSQQQHQSQSGTQSNPNANGNAGISLPMSRGETNATANISDQGSSGPGLGLGLGIGLGAGEEYREIKCCFSVTIRRDAWGVPVAIMGQWIVSDLTPFPKARCRVLGRA